MPGEVTENNKEKMIKILSIVIGIFLIIILFFIKYYKPNFSLFWFIGLIALIVILSSVIYFSFDIYNKYQGLEKEVKNEKKIPKAVTLEQAKEIIKKQLLSPEYADYAVGWIQHKIYNAGKDGKSRILIVQLEQTPYSSKPYQFFIMNMHYPLDVWSYIEQEKYNSYELTNAINKLALTPMKSPNVEKMTAEDPLTGRRVVTEKIIQVPKFEPQKIEEKKEDLK